MTVNFFLILIAGILFILNALHVALGFSALDWGFVFLAFGMLSYGTIFVRNSNL